MGFVSEQKSIGNDQISSCESRAAAHHVAQRTIGPCQASQSLADSVRRFCPLIFCPRGRMNRVSIIHHEAAT